MRFGQDNQQRLEVNRVRLAGARLLGRWLGALSKVHSARQESGVFTHTVGELVHASAGEGKIPVGG